MAEDKMADMLDLYMDDITKYIEEEEEEIIENVNHESSFTMEDTISIDTYVNEKLGLNVDCSNLWHSGLRDLKETTNSPVFDFMISISNDIANQYPEYVLQGYFLLVIDHRGNRGTYINPDKIRYALTEKEILKEIKIMSKEGVSNLKDLGVYLASLESLWLQIAEIEKIKAVIKTARRNVTFEQIVQNEEKRGKTI